jgi:hypothetical protein
VLVQAAALAAPGIVRAHDINTPAGHQAEDAVVHDAASEPVLDNGTRIRSAWASQATAAAVAADPGQAGQWGPVAAWPVVGIHVALLPNGKVLAWDSVGDAATETFPVHDFTRATVYDPIAGTPTHPPRSTRVTTSSAPGSRTSSTARCSSPAGTTTRNSRASPRHISSTT